MTPEELLEETIRVRWPSGVSESEYGDVVRVVIGFSAILRPAPKESKPRKQAGIQLEPDDGSASALVASRPSARKKRAEPRMDKEALRAKVESALAKGTFSIKAIMERTGARNYQQVWEILAKHLKARKSTDSANGEMVWALKHGPPLRVPPQPPQKKKRKRRVMAWGPEYAERLRNILSEKPMPMAEAARRLGIHATGAIRMARKMGFIKRGRGEHVTWELPVESATPMKEGE